MHALQVYLDTVPMPSMEVYSGTAGKATQHFEDWMQTQYSPLTLAVGKWLDLSDEDKAAEFLGQLNTYFEKRTALLGEEGTFLFPSKRPSADSLQVCILGLEAAHAGWCLFLASAELQC